MNLYILTEGTTEKLFHPHLINVVAPHLSQVFERWDVMHNNFYIFGNMGYPHVLNQGLSNAIEDIKLHNATLPDQSFDYLLLIADVDDETVEEREKEFYDRIPAELNFKCLCFFQNRCIETWFLANKKIVKTHPLNEKLAAFKFFYNVALKDPELMPLYPEEKNHSHFHYKYLKCLLDEHSLRYSKTNQYRLTKSTILWR